MGLGVEVRLQPTERVERRGELDRAVVVHDHAGYRTGPLRDDALALRTARQLRHRGQLRQATQGERRRGVRVAVRKASDRSRRSRADRPAEQWFAHEDS